MSAVLDGLLVAVIVLVALAHALRTLAPRGLRERLARALAGHGRARLAVWIAPPGAGGACGSCNDCGTVAAPGSVQDGEARVPLETIGRRR